ncbi:MAG: amino acid permease [Rhodobacteraceae bacterium]|nr:amino acid permease [Paracoccaceae bacterium]
MQWLRIKSIEQLLSIEEGKKLHRQLTAFDLTLLGIGCIIGTGIFVLTGTASANYAGPALVVSFLLAGFACGCAALMYAELASMVPVSGSAYTYTYATMGEAAAWIMGWNLILEYAVSAGAVSAGWSGYFVGILKTGGIELPLSLTAVPANGGIMNLPAILISLFVTFLLVLGTRESARFNAILVAIKLVAIFIFLIIAVPNINTDLWEPFMPYGFSGVSTGAALIFFAYIGFDAVSTAAEETKNPNRDVPIGLIASLLICTVLYIVVSATLTGIASYKDLDNAEPLAFALRGIGYNWGSALVATGALAGITTVLLVLIYGQTRIFYAMARDGMLPQGLVKLHPRYKTPHVITIITGIVCAGFAGFMPINEIAELSNIGTLFAFVMVSIGVLIMRSAKPDLHRPFRCPAVWVVGILAVLSCGYLMISLPTLTWERFFIWSVIGILVYAFYGYRKSLLHPKASG